MYAWAQGYLSAANVSMLVHRNEAPTCASSTTPRCSPWSSIIATRTRTTSRSALSTATSPARRRCRARNRRARSRRRRSRPRPPRPPPSKAAISTSSTGPAIRSNSSASIRPATTCGTKTSSRASWPKAQMSAFRSSDRQGLPVEHQGHLAGRQHLVHLPRHRRVQSHDRHAALQQAHRSGLLHHRIGVGARAKDSMSRRGRGPRQPDGGRQTAGPRERKPKRRLPRCAAKRATSKVAVIHRGLAAPGRRTPTLYPPPYKT